MKKTTKNILMGALLTGALAVPQLVQAAIAVDASNLVDNEAGFSGTFNTTTPEYVLGAGSILAGKDVTLDTGIQGDHNTKSITSASEVQITKIGGPDAGNPDADNFYWQGKVAALFDDAPLIGETDGSDSPTGTGNVFSPSSPTSATYRMTIDLGGLYNISSIATYARHTGGSDQQQSQRYSVYGASSMTGTFSLIATVDFYVNFTLTNWGSRYGTSEVQIYDDGAADIATNIGALRFEFQKGASFGNQPSYLREIQAFGTAVPEPSSALLLGLGVAGLALRKRRNNG